MHTQNNVYLFSSSKNAMQSGHLTHKVWILLFPQTEGISIDPIMQWISQTQPGQKTMRFDSKESAMTYCERYHIY